MFVFDLMLFSDTVSSEIPLSGGPADFYIFVNFDPRRSNLDFLIIFHWFSQMNYQKFDTRQHRV